MSRFSLHQFRFACRKTRVQVLVFLYFTASLIAGCGRATEEVAGSASGSDRQRMVSAIQAGRWDEAWRYSDAVLIESADDPAVLEAVAEVAYQTKRKSIAADLLVESARLDQWRDPSRISRALQGLLTTGRLFDGLNLLRDSVLASPNDVQRRRLLFDLLVATEQHVEAAIHRRALIRERAIDGELLFAAFRYEKRGEEVDSLELMVDRNPSDIRPLVGKAKRLMEASDYGSAIRTLQRIVDRHPEFLVAHALLGRAIVASGNWNGLAEWSRTLPLESSGQSVEKRDADGLADIWSTVGDWAVSQKQIKLATEAYGRAAKSNQHHLHAWTELAALLSAHPAGGVNFKLIARRANSLMKLRQAYADFGKQDQKLPALTTIVNSLSMLGRMWEAEAWAAYGTTLPSLSRSEKTSIEQLRASIVGRLEKQTQWQARDRIPSWSWLPERTLAEAISTLKGDADAFANSSGGDAPKNRNRPAEAGPIVVPSLRDEASERGLAFFGRTDDDLDEPGVMTYQMIGCGGAAIDYNLDGWPDIYLVTAGGKPRLQDSAANAMFRNLQGQFENVSANCAADDHGFGQGVAVGDLNEDGFDDLLLLNYGRNSLWINNGDGTFTDQSDRWLPPASAWSTSAAIADFDADGLADAFIANYCAGLEPSTEACYETDGLEVRTCSPIHFKADRDRFLAGQGNGHFRDRTNDWNGVPAILGRGLGVVAGQFNEQPGIDLLVANDMTANHFWTAEHPRFEESEFAMTETGLLLGLATDGQSRNQGSMGIAVADLNDDSVVDFYVTNFELEHNTAYLSRGTAGWNDETGRHRLLDSTIALVGFGTQAVDFDNNGQPELIVTNGHVDHFSNPSGMTRYRQPVQLFGRTTTGEFTPVGSRLHDPYFQTEHVGRALWKLDANRDGREDLAITHQTEPVSLLINRTPSDQKSISLQLVATKDSRTAVGSVLTVVHGGRRSVHALTSGDGFLCTNQRQITVGLGEHPSAVEITVRWPGGDEQVWKDLQPGGQWLLVQGQPAFYCDDFRSR